MSESAFTEECGGRAFACKKVLNAARAGGKCAMARGHRAVVYAAGSSALVASKVGDLKLFILERERTSLMIRGANVHAQASSALAEMIRKRKTRSRSF